MAPINHIIILSILTIIYLFGINLFASATNVSYNSPPQETESIISGGITTKVGTGDSATATVEKKRWYGRIVEEHGKDYTLSDLYIFRLIKLPLKNKMFSFIFVHAFFFSMIFWFYLILFLVNLLKDGEKTERRYYDNETLGNQSIYHSSG